MLASGLTANDHFLKVRLAADRTTTGFQPVVRFALWDDAWFYAIQPVDPNFRFRRGTATIADFTTVHARETSSRSEAARIDDSLNPAHVLP